MITSAIKSTLLVTSALAVAAPSVAEAQDSANAPTSADSGDIIVTARKRDETSIAVPVVLTAVSGAELERRAIVKLDDLATVVPQLQLGTGATNVLGGVVAIRGIAGSENNAFADQAVSFNVDGVQVAKALIRRMGEMDIGQIEVLKGPQALFFGKNSPGGIISIRSADPTRSFEAKASAGYEFYAREWRGDGFVSGPITDTLGARLAVYGTTMRGWFDNDIGGFNNPLYDSDFYRSGPKHTPKPKEFAIRGTLKWEPSDRFNARLKVSYNELKDVGQISTTERMFCPLGTPQLGGGPDNCKLDAQGAHLDVGPLLYDLFPDKFHKDGRNYLRQKQELISHEMNYDLSDQLTLTSVTGYYYVSQRYAENFSSAWNPSQILPSGNHFSSREFSQEVRLTSDYDGPVNFLTGGYYHHSRVSNSTVSLSSAVLTPTGVNPNQINNGLVMQKGTAYSWFAQVRVNPVEHVEITAGGRYSYERKRLPRIEAMPGGPGPAPIDRVVIPPNPLFPRKESWTNFSPEFSISYRPTRDLTLFANHKHGFLSGGFNGAVSNLNSDLRFDQQKIKGFEGGVKARLLDGALRTNFALYRYVVTGMQINSTFITAAGVVQQQVLNAGKVTVKGAELDFNYRTPLEGLSLHGAVGYNDGKYNKFSINCYRGQTQEEGCNAGIPTSTVIGGQTFTTFSVQDLSGHRLLRAPKWSGSIGAGYEADIGSNLRFGLNSDLFFSSSYDPDVTAPPHAIQKSYQLLDASARIGAQDDSWEVALIGKNLTDKYYLLRSGDVSFSGTVPGRSENDPRPAILGDTQGGVNRGRQIMLRLTVRYGGS